MQFGVVHLGRQMDKQILQCPRILISSHGDCPVLIIMRVLYTSISGNVIGGHFRGAAKSFLVLALNYANCLLLAPSLTQGSSYKYYPLRSDGAHIPQDVCGLRKETKILDRPPEERPRRNRRWRWWSYASA